MEKSLALRARDAVSRIVASLAAVLLFFAAGMSPATAVVLPDPDKPKPAPDLRGWFGCADFSILNPLKPSSRLLTGWVVAILVIFILFLALLRLVAVSRAGDDKGKASAALEAIRNSIAGLLAIVLLFPLGVTVLQQLININC